MRTATHPGEMLKYEFLDELGISARELARSMNVPPNRITTLINGSRGMTADTALRLEKVLGVSAEFWMRLQDAHDLSKAQNENDYTGLARRKELA